MTIKMRLLIYWAIMVSGVALQGQDLIGQLTQLGAWNLTWL